MGICLTASLYMVCFRKRQSSPENVVRRAVVGRPEVSTINGKWNGSSQADLVDYDAQSPKSNDYEETDVEHQDEPLDRRSILFMLVFWRCI